MRRLRVILLALMLLFVTSVSGCGDNKANSITNDKEKVTNLSEKDSIDESSDDKESLNNKESSNNDESTNDTESSKDNTSNNDLNNDLNNDNSLNNETPGANNNNNLTQNSSLEIHYIDVGQGDASLIICDGEAMMFDFGDNNKGTLLRSYLMKSNITKLKYAIGSHPDSDHIGGMDVILYNFDCENVMMPSEEKTSATYRDVIDTMKNKNYKNTLPVVGKEYKLGNASFKILAPCKNYKESNNNSIAILLTHGENTFLFTGDAEEEAEGDILNNGLSIKADVYQVGHHGSSSSSSEKFLDAVSPKYAIISCGEDNSYRHPHAETLNNLRARGIKVFRTDEQGTIIVKSDGKTLTWNMSPSESWKAGEGNTTGNTGSNNNADGNSGNSNNNSNSNNNENIQQNTTAQTNGAGYVCNISTNKFHYPSCSSIKSMSAANKLETNATREELINMGYSPCGRCKP